MQIELASLQSSLKKSYKTNEKQQIKTDLNRTRSPNNKNINITNDQVPEDEQPTFYKNKKSKKKEKINLQGNVAYPQATIREYLNQKRTTQNKVCHVLFCIYMIVVVMLLGVGFFFGNYGLIGETTNGAATSPAKCPLYVSQDYTSCTSCPSGTLYIQKICTTSSPYIPTFSTNLDKQITMYTLKSTYTQIVYSTLISLVVSSICFIVLICFAKIIYLYVGLMFVMILGFAFFLLKSLRANMSLYDQQSLFYQDAAKILPIAYVLMALYLVVFPFVLFSPKKIATAVKIIAKMNKYFKRMSSVNLFTYLVVYLVWGLFMVQIFLVMNMFTSGTSSTQSTSFMYVFTSVSLSNPAVLVIHFFGIYWFFSTIVSWHKYFTSNAMCLWYFQEGQRLFPVTRGLKRSWHNLGTAALDALLLPFQWISLLLYGFTKFSQQQKQAIQTDKTDDSVNIWQCTFGIRQCFNSLYCKLNTQSASSAPLTNYAFKQSCQISANTFSHNGYKFFNLGSTLTLLLTTFNSLIWLIISYSIIYSTVYSTTSPPPITSMGLPLFCVFIGSLICGSIQSNMYTAAMDCLVFCFLLEKKSNVGYTKNQVKDVLEAFYHQTQDGQANVEMWEYQNQ